MAPSPESRRAPAIDGFEYLELLGSGGFSEVYLYQQKLPRRRVAIKVLHVDSLDRSLRRQFIAEANLMAQLSSHPAIATIYAANITDDEHPYLVMEFCSGGSLGATYRAQPLSVEEVLNVGVRVASALEAAHRAGIVHRDVKPANILMTDYGVPVLTDFGISVGDDGVAESTLLTSSATSDDVTSLSVPWAPPEAFDDSPVSNERSDVYSLGATLLTLLEGRTPFEVETGSNSPLHLSRRIERGELTPSIRTDVPDVITSVLARAMSVRPANRYPSALDLGLALQEAQRTLGLSVTPLELEKGAAPASAIAEVVAAETVLRAPSQPQRPTTATSTPQRPTAASSTPHHQTVAPTTPQRSRRTLLIAAGAVAAAAVIATVAIIALQRPDTPVQPTQSQSPGQSPEAEPGASYPLCDDGVISKAASLLNKAASDFTPVATVALLASVAPPEGLLCGYELTGLADGESLQTFFYDGTGSTYETVRGALPDGFTCDDQGTYLDTAGNDVLTQTCGDGSIRVELYKFVQAVPELVMGEKAYVSVEVYSH
jgi:serine/threonine protein kinase